MHMRARLQVDFVEAHPRATIHQIRFAVQCGAVCVSCKNKISYSSATSRSHLRDAHPSATTETLLSTINSNNQVRNLQHVSAFRESYVLTKLGEVEIAHWQQQRRCRMEAAARVTSAKKKRKCRLRHEAPLFASRSAASAATLHCVAKTRLCSGGNKLS